MNLSLTLSLLALTFATAGCGNGNAAKPTDSNTMRTESVEQTTTSSVGTTTKHVQKGGLTGFGATVTQWNRHHEEDSRFSPGSAYDPDPSLGDGERFNDRYYTVSPQDGRITTYSMRFPAQTGVEEAKAFLLASEFPQDAKIVWFKRKISCAQMLVRSATLGHVIHGGAFIEFSSGEAGDHYDASAVSEAILFSITGSGKDIGC